MDPLVTKLVAASGGNAAFHAWVPFHLVPCALNTSLSYAVPPLRLESSRGQYSSAGALLFPPSLKPRPLTPNFRFPRRRRPSRGKTCCVLLQFLFRRVHTRASCIACRLSATRVAYSWMGQCLSLFILRVRYCTSKSRPPFIVSVLSSPSRPFFPHTHTYLVARSPFWSVDVTPCEYVYSWT